MNKFLKTAILGAASGAAAAYFLGTEKGKELVAKAKVSFEDYKSDPDSYREAAKEKVAEYKDMATDTFAEYKEKWESGEFSAGNISQAVKSTVEQVKDKVNGVVQTVSEDEVIIPEEEVAEAAEKVAEAAEDIVIDLTQEAPTEEPGDSEAE